jgi:putative transposase
MADHVHMMISIPPKYAVSTVGRDEDVIRNYIRHQEKEDERLEQLGLWR